MSNKNRNKKMQNNEDNQKTPEASTEKEFLDQEPVAPTAEDTAEDTDLECEESGESDVVQDSDGDSNEATIGSDSSESASSDVDSAEPLTGHAANPNLANAVPAPAPGAQETAVAHLNALHAKVGHLTQDRAKSDHGVAVNDWSMIKEMKDRMAKGKEVHFSDGNRERLSLLHKKVIK